MEILNYREVNKGALIASFSLKIPKWGNFIIHGISLFKKENNRWINFPQKQVDENGVKKYFNICMFDDPKMSEKFKENVLKVLDEFLLTYKPQANALPSNDEEEGIPF